MTDSIFVAAPENISIKSRSNNRVVLGWSTTRTASTQLCSKKWWSGRSNPNQKVLLPNTTNSATPTIWETLTSSFTRRNQGAIELMKNWGRWPGTTMMCWANLKACKWVDTLLPCLKRISPLPNWLLKSHLTRCSMTHWTYLRIHWLWTDPVLLTQWSGSPPSCWIITWRRPAKTYQRS